MRDKQEQQDKEVNECVDAIVEMLSVFSTVERLGIISLVTRILECDVDIRLLKHANDRKSELENNKKGEGE